VILLLLLFQDETLAEKAQRLAKDPKANAVEIAKLGPAALRPLLEVRTPELEPILLPLRVPDEKFRQKLDKDINLGLTWQSVTLSVILESVLNFYEVPFWIDPYVQPRLEKRLADQKFHGTANDALQFVCKEGNVEFGLVRGRIVVSTPERLWGWPAAKLGEAELKSLVEKWQEPAAARRLLDAGEEAIPLLEKAGARDLVAKIRERGAPPIFGETLSVERQSPTEADRPVLKALREKTVRLVDGDVTLSAAFKRLLFQTGLDGGAASSADALRVGCSLSDIKLGDALYFLLIPNGYDVYAKNGRLYADTRERVEKIVAKK
jgi:hypothetical protein